MADVAVMLGLPGGLATFTVQPVAGDTVTIPGAKRFVIGPSIFGCASQASKYILQVPSTDAGQSANTYRWENDVPIGIAALTTHSYSGDCFVPLGGI